MANHNGISKIYPAMEMKAVDMAEIMKAALLFDGIIQGCQLSIPSNTTNLKMTAGRMVIQGRLAEFEETQQIPVPTVSSNTTCTIVAVSDLTPPEGTVPFYVAVLTPTELSELNNKVTNSGTDEFYNVGLGTRYLTLGTCTVGSGGVVSGLVLNTTNSPLQSNKTVLESTRSTLANSVTTVNTRVTNVNNSLTSVASRVSTLETKANTAATGIATINGKGVVSDAGATACNATIASIGASATMTIYVCPGQSNTQWPASSSGTTTEKQRYSQNEAYAAVAANIMANANQGFFGFTELLTNNNNVIIVGWNCSTSSGKGTVKLRNLATSAQSNITVTGKALLLTEKKISAI